MTQMIGMTMKQCTTMQQQDTRTVAGVTTPMMKRQIGMNAHATTRMATHGLRHGDARKMKCRSRRPTLAMKKASQMHMYSFQQTPKEASTCKMHRALSVSSLYLQRRQLGEQKGANEKHKNKVKIVQYISH